MGFAACGDGSRHMTPRTRNWLLQTLGLLVGVIPAILVVFALPLGLICCAVLSIGFVHPRSRPVARLWRHCAGVLLALLAVRTAEASATTGPTTPRVSIRAP